MKHDKKRWDVFKLGSTLAVILVAITPATFHIPSMYRIWLFLLAVLWMMICTIGEIWF
jgi:hypothetical protein